MRDVECPYCGAGVDINHDDGYGYEEDGNYEQECRECEKVFAYTTWITVSHQAKKADCLNGAPHQYKKTSTYPPEFARMRCVDCGHETKLVANDPSSPASVSESGAARCYATNLTTE